MADTIPIRSCTEADIHAVLALWARAAAPHSKPDTPEGILQRLQRDRELFLLAFDGDILVGSLIAGWDGWRGNLYRMAVASEYRRRGVGTMLVEEVERRLAEAGCTRVYAAVGSHSSEAIAFWEAAGFAPQTYLTQYAKDLVAT